MRPRFSADDRTRGLLLFLGAALACVDAQLDRCDRAHDKYADAIGAVRHSDLNIELKEHPLSQAEIWSSLGDLDRALRHQQRLADLRATLTGRRHVLLAPRPRAPQSRCRPSSCSRPRSRQHRTPRDARGPPDDDPDPEPEARSRRLRLAPPAPALYAFGCIPREERE